LALTALGGGCRDDDAGFARAGVIEGLDGTIGGVKAVARPGDFLLENDKVRVAIVGARPSMGPGLYGGGIVDADLQPVDPARLKGNGNDQFAELFPTVSMNVVVPEEGGVFVLADGSDGGEAIVRVEGPTEPFLTLLVALWAILGAPHFDLTTDYIAEPGKPWIKIRSTAVVDWDGVGERPVEGETVSSSDDTLPIIDWAIESGMVMGDFYLSGGSLDVFGPDMGFDEDLAVYESMQRGENTFVDPFKFDFLAGVGDGVSYGIAPATGASFIPLFTASQTIVVGGGEAGSTEGDRFPPNSAFTYERYLFIGHGDVGSIVDGWVEARGVAYGEVGGFVVDGASGAPVSGADVFVYRPGAAAPWSQWRTDVAPTDSRADGSFGGRLPVGQWELVVHQVGRPDSQRVPIAVTEGERVDVVLGAERGGLLRFEIRDEVGRLVPAKLTVFASDGVPARNSVLGDGFIGGNPEAVVFPMYGAGEVALPPGSYYAVASRGTEYEIDISDPFVISETRSADLDLQVVRSVETDGWVSADLHVHSAPSHDSGVQLADRVATMVCEGVEFFSSTDHDFVTDFAPVVQDLGLEEWVQTAVGTEITTIELGHFLGFPIKHDFTAESGGALDWTDLPPKDLVDWMRTQADGKDPFVYVGHPRDGILGYFDQYGFDPYQGSPGDDEPTVVTPQLAITNPLLQKDEMSWSFDGLELLNGKRLELLRTPTASEMSAFAAGDDVPIYQFVTRTMEEQAALESGDERLGYGLNGQIDDWFALLNLGFRYTAIGNSDTHGLTSIEAGCPRNYVLTDVDEPSFLDDQAVADAVRAHRVVASYGPFVRMTVDGAQIGSDVVASGGSVTVDLDVQAPTWMQVDRVELYANGTLVREWTFDPVPDVAVFSVSEQVPVTEDTWFVAIVMGPGDLAPLFTPVEIPYIDLEIIVTEALSGVEAVGSFLDPAVPIPREYPVLPFAITNPIWVDTDGDGFDAPGRPSWFVAPVEPKADEPK
jgi:hypothetical protein